MFITPKWNQNFSTTTDARIEKIVGGRGFAPDPTGGAYDAPPDPLVGVFRAAPTSRNQRGSFMPSFPTLSACVPVFQVKILVTLIYIYIYIVMGCGAEGPRPYISGGGLQPPPAPPVYALANSTLTQTSHKTQTCEFDVPTSPNSKLTEEPQDIFQYHWNFYTPLLIYIDNFPQLLPVEI